MLLSYYSRSFVWSIIRRLFSRGVFLLLVPYFDSLALGQYSGDGGQAQDAEAVRQRILHAADQLDNLQASSEALQLEVQRLKDQTVQDQEVIAGLKQENDASKEDLAHLHLEFSELQNAFNQAEVNHAKERQILVDEISKMVAGTGAIHSQSLKKKRHTEESSQTLDSSSSHDPSSSQRSESSSDSPPVGSNDRSSTRSDDGQGENPGNSAGSEQKNVDTANSSSTDSTDSIESTGRRASPTADPSGSPPVQHGYYHIVASGETLGLIASAYRDQGVQVTVSAIRKANHLPPGSELHLGQKLFIPKPLPSSSP